MSEPVAIGLHLEMVGPMTGDMFIAALLDTFPNYEDAVFETIEATCERHPVDCRLEFTRSNDLRGHRFIMEPYTRYFGHLSVQPVEEREAWSKLQAELASASLPGGVLRHANGILTLLARHQGAGHAAAWVGRGILAYVGALPEQAPPNAPRIRRPTLLSGVGFAREPGISEGSCVRVSCLDTCLDTLDAGSNPQARPIIPPAGALQNGQGERRHD